MRGAAQNLTCSAAAMHVTPPHWLPINMSIERAEADDAMVRALKPLRAHFADVLMTYRFGGDGEQAAFAAEFYGAEHDASRAALLGPIFDLFDKDGDGFLSEAEFAFFFDRNWVARKTYAWLFVDTVERMSRERAWSEQHTATRIAGAHSISHVLHAPTLNSMLIDTR